MTLTPWEIRNRNTNFLNCSLNFFSLSSPPLKFFFPHFLFRRVVKNYLGDIYSNFPLSLLCPYSPKIRPWECVVVISFHTYLPYLRGVTIPETCVTNRCVCSRSLLQHMAGCSLEYPPSSMPRHLLRSFVSSDQRPGCARINESSMLNRAAPS